MNDCICKDEYTPISISPLVCGKNNGKLFQNLCAMEYYRFVRNSYKTPNCLITQDKKDPNLECIVSNTINYPIS